MQVIDTLGFSLDEQYNPEVYGIRQMLLDKNTIVTILILADLLQPLIKFSTYLQGNIDFSKMMMKAKVRTQHF